jgi:putative transposase
MARPLRLEFTNALYYLASIGERRETFYHDNTDSLQCLEILGQGCERFNSVIHGYCQITNHFHLLTETIDGHLSRGMRQLNGVYTQNFNSRHHESGHVLQGQYKAILCKKIAIFWN